MLLHTLRSMLGLWSGRPGTQRTRKAVPNTVSAKPWLETLESRIALNADTFINPAGGSWSTGSNWSLGRPPTTGDDVNIPALQPGAAVTLPFPGTATINTLALDGTLNLGGSLTVAGDVQGSGTLNLTGSLIGATVTQGITVDAQNTSSATLDGVTLNGTLVDIENTLGYVSVYHGLNLGGQVIIGNTTGTAGGALIFWGSQTLSGTGSVFLDGAGGSPSILECGSANQILTIGQGIVVHGHNYGYISNPVNGGSVVNEGAIEEDGPGTLNLSNVSLAPSGRLSLLNAGVAFGGLIHNAGTVTIDDSSNLVSSVINAGTVTIDDSSVLSGGFTQTETGRLEVLIGSRPNSTHRIGESNASLAGTLAAIYVNGFTPLPGDSYLIIAAPVTGTFGTVTGGEAVYGPNSVRLNAYVTTVTPTSLQWNDTRGGVDYSYQVTGATVPQSTTVALYWSSSDQFADRIGGPITSKRIAAGAPVGMSKSFHVQDLLFEREGHNVPDGPTDHAAYLLVVTDPDNVLGNFSQATNVLAVPNPLYVPQGQFTFDQEGNDNPKSPSFSRHIHYPGNPNDPDDNSGVTIGRGYDLGDRKEPAVIQDLTAAGIPLAQAQLIAAGVGKKGPAAQNFVLQHQAEIGTITWEQQQRLFNNTYPTYVSKAQKLYNKITNGVPDAVAWDNLDPAIRIILVDLRYNGQLIKAVIRAAMTNQYNVLAAYIGSHFPLMNKRNIARVFYLDTYE